MRTDLAAGLNSFSWRNSHAVTGIICSHCQKIVSAALTPSWNISRCHAPTEVVVKEAGKFLKLYLLRKTPPPISTGCCPKGDLKWKRKLRQLRFWQGLVILSLLHSHLVVERSFIAVFAKSQRIILRLSGGQIIKILHQHLLCAEDKIPDRTRNFRQSS